MPFLHPEMLVLSAIALTLTLLGKTEKIPSQKSIDAENLIHTFDLQFIQIPASYVLTRTCIR